MNHHAINTYWESGGIAPCILNLGTKMEVRGMLHATAALPPGKDTPVPIGYETGWVPELVWALLRREKICLPAGNRTPVIQTAALSLY
jgi:hypothetical protein